MKHSKTPLPDNAGTSGQNAADRPAKRRRSAPWHTSTVLIRAARADEPPVTGTALMRQLHERHIPQQPAVNRRSSRCPPRLLRPRWWRPLTRQKPRPRIRQWTVPHSNAGSRPKLRPLYLSSRRPIPTFRILPSSPQTFSRIGHLLSSTASIGSLSGFSTPSFNTQSKCAWQEFPR